MGSGVCIIGKTSSPKHPQALFPDPLGGGVKHPSKPPPPAPMHGGAPVAKGNVAPLARIFPPFEPGWEYF